MEDAFRFADDLGPFKLVHIHRPSVGLKAVVAIDNIACGLAIGGVRMAPDVSTEEAFRLARNDLQECWYGCRMAAANQ
jgi:glutamate dehydrogenase (NAD(P)+)